MDSINPFDLDNIVRTYNIQKSDLNTTLRLVSRDTLKDIYDAYCRAYPTVQKARDRILRDITDLVDHETAHSIRSRVKNPEHLIEKIIRNVAKKPQKYGKINDKNFYKIITDLIGIRIMILGREPWIAVHNKLESLFDNDETKYIAENSFLEGFTATPQKAYVAEKPIIHFIKRDKGFYEKSDIFHKFTPKPSLEGYRSIHYTIRTTSNYYCEIQVRTIFEEGWLEFDHLIKYPYDQANPIKNDLLDMLANMVKISDDVIIYYNEHITQALAKIKESGSDSAEIVNIEPEPLPACDDNRPFGDRLSDYILTI